MPYEISIVSCPADSTVGYQRKLKAGKQIIVKGKVGNVPMWRIEIENQYGYKTTFLPYYDETKKEVMLKREMNT